MKNTNNGSSDEAVLNGYDDKTEILTKQGWKFLREICKPVEIAYLDTKTGELQYTPPILIRKKYYCGKMCKIKTKTIDICITPTQKLYIAFRPSTIEERRLTKRTNFQNGIAKNIFGKCYYLKRDLKWNAKEVDEFNIPNTKFIIPMDLWLEFLGYYLSEGSAFITCDRHRVSMPQIKENERFYEVCKQVAQYCNVTGKRDKDRYVIGCKGLTQYLMQFGHSYNKYIDIYYKQLNNRQLKILLKALIVGDGRIIKTLKSEAYSYYTVSKQLANDVQEIAVKCGYVANITSRKARTQKCRNGIAKGNYELYEVIITTKQTTPEVNNSRCKNKMNKEMHENIIQYKGYVYFCDNPNYILYIKRNGKTCWC